MSITSLQFLLYVGIFLTVYFTFSKSRYQRQVILAANLFVMAVTTGIPSIICALALLAVIYLCGRKTEKYRKTDKKRAGRWYAFGLIADIGSLLVCKYLFDHVHSGYVRIFNTSGNLPDLSVPIGLSYFALSTAAYLYDVRHGKIAAEKNYADFVNYATYWPALFEGPFNLYRDLMPRLREKHRFDWDRMVSGLQRLLWGYFKKLVIADRISIPVSEVIFGEQPQQGWTIFAIMMLYSFQIYADFSGGIDIIMGISEIMGITLPENFRSPLISKNVTEYWQRWHMSFGTIMEKYLYFPIVFSRTTRRISKHIKDTHKRNVFVASLASFLVFIVVGIWHGTGWNYVVYGLYQAIFVSSAVFLKPFYTSCKKHLHINEKSLTWRIFCVLRTFVILTFGRYLIRANNLTDAVDLLRRTFSIWNPWVLFDDSLLNFGLDWKNWMVMLLGCLLLIIVDILHEKGFHFRQWLMTKDIVFRYAVYMALLFGIIIFGIYGPEYNKQDFIYGGY